MSNLLYEINEHFKLGDCSIVDGREDDSPATFGFMFGTDEANYYATYEDGFNVEFVDIPETFKDEVLSYIDLEELIEIETVVLPGTPMYGAVEQTQGHFVIAHNSFQLNINKVKYDGMGTCEITTYFPITIELLPEVPE